MVSAADDDLAAFARLSAEVQAPYVAAANKAWETSPFGWIKKEPSRRVGAIGEALVKAWARHEGLTVSPPADSGHDCVIDGARIEVKFSTLWEGGGFTFQQIRDQSYEIGALLGIQPQEVSLWFVPKAILWSDRVPFQHGGRKGRDTKWLSFQADTPPEWLRQYGGTLREARAALEEAKRTLGR